MAKRILIVDPKDIFRDPMAALCQSFGFSTCTAQSAAEAMGRLREHAVDLILMEIELPHVHGIELLQRIRLMPQYAKTPVIVLTSAPERGFIVRAASLGVRDYILKSCFATARLVTRIRELIDPPAVKTRPTLSDQERPALVAEQKATASLVRERSVPPKDSRDPSSWPKLLTRDQTLERLDRIADGRTIAGVVAQVIAMVSSPRVDIADIVKVIESDPVLATRVLQFANSAAFASKERVRTVDDAARNIGLRGIQNMALSVGIFNAFPPDELDGFNTVRCWQHSFAVAELMGMFVKDTDALQEGNNHLVGLCHDLGEVLLRQHFTPVYEEILEFSTSHGLPLHEVESVALGIRHAELVSRLLSRAGLPLGIVQAIREFYERQVRGQAAGMSDLARGLGMANLIAHGLMLASSTHEAVAPISRMDWRSLAGDRPVPAIEPIRKRNDIVVATNILARLPDQDEKRMLQPLLARQDLAVHYVRPEIFISLDPVEFALAHLSNVSVSSALPAPETLGNVDALVVAGIRAGAAPLTDGDLRAWRNACGRPDLPVLMLFSQGEAPAPFENITYARVPIALQELHAWIHSAVQAKQAGSLQATAG